MKDGIYIVDVLSNGTVIQGLKRRLFKGKWILTRYDNPETHRDVVVSVIKL